MRARISVDEMSIIGSITAWCAAAATSASTRVAAFGRLAIARVTSCEQLAPVAPGVQPGVLVLADDQHPLRAGLGGLQLAHGVERIAGAAAAQLAAVEREAGLAGDRQPYHRLAVGRRRELARLLRRPAGRHPAQLVELQLVARDAGQRDVGDVHRIEGAAEDADALQAGAQSAHARGRRKSL